MPFGLLTESCFSRRIKTAEVFILYYITSPVGCQAEFRVTADFCVKKKGFFRFSLSEVSQKLFL